MIGEQAWAEEHTRRIELVRTLRASGASSGNVQAEGVNPQNENSAGPETETRLYSAGSARCKGKGKGPAQTAMEEGLHK